MPALTDRYLPDDGLRLDFTVDTTILDGRFINQTTRLAMDNVAHRVIDAQDVGIREALITLGWTPPCKP